MSTPVEIEQSKLSKLNKSVAIPASEIGFAERYSRGKTSHTVHVWWARRPHSAMELLVKEVLRRTPRKNSPAVLDLFGGGGTIPIEVANAGGHAYSIDCNPLSIFIQKSLLEWSQTAFNKIGKRRVLELLHSSGHRVLTRLGDAREDLPHLRVKLWLSTFGYPLGSQMHRMGQLGLGHVSQIIVPFVPQLGGQSPPPPE